MKTITSAIVCLLCFNTASFSQNNNTVNNQITLNLFPPSSTDGANNESLIFCLCAQETKQPGNAAQSIIYFDPVFDLSINQNYMTNIFTSFVIVKQKNKHK